METRIAAITDESIAEAAELLRARQLVAFPTETVYGLGAVVFDSKAVAQIFAVKDRPMTDPLIVHIADQSQLNRVVFSLSDLAQQLMTAFWPGPLTLILPDRYPKIIPNIVSAGLSTVAVRMPAHPVALALIRAAGVPIAAPSANRFAHTSPTTAQHVYDDLAGRIPLILDGGPTQIGLESTILDLNQQPPRILRPGGTSLTRLREFIPDIQVSSRYAETTAEAQTAPGQLLTHYAPLATLYLFEGEKNAVYTTIRQAATKHLANGQRVGLLLADEDAASLADLTVSRVLLGSNRDLVTVAQRLFAGLRALDAENVTVILARDFPETDLGLAIHDRLIRAAAGRIIRC